MVVSQGDRRLKCEKYSSVSNNLGCLWSCEVYYEGLRADWELVCSIWRLLCVVSVVRSWFEVFATYFLRCFASEKVRKLTNV